MAGSSPSERSQRDAADAEQLPDAPASQRPTEGPTRAEAERVAEERGLGGYRDTVEITSPPKVGVGIIALSLLLGALGVMFLFVGRDETFVLVGGGVFLAAAIAILIMGIVSSRTARLVPGSLFLFDDGLIDGLDGRLDPYRWDELELVEKHFVFHGGYEYRAQRRKTLAIGPRGGSRLLPIPPTHQRIVTDLAMAGNATFR